MKLIKVKKVVESFDIYKNGENKLKLIIRR